MKHYFIPFIIGLMVFSCGSSVQQEPDPQTDSKEEKKPVTEVKAEEKKNDKALTLDKIRKADLGMVPDDDLEEAMKTAAEAEDYVLAAKIRDEIRSRKGGN